MAENNTSQVGIGQVGALWVGAGSPSTLDVEADGTAELALQWGEAGSEFSAAGTAELSLTWAANTWELPVIAVGTADPAINGTLAVVAAGAAALDLKWIAPFGNNVTCIAAGPAPDIGSPTSARSSFAE